MAPIQGELRSAPCMRLLGPGGRGQQLLGEALSRAVAEVKKGHERHCASLVHEFGCTTSGYKSFTKISRVDKPKVKEQRGVSLLGDGGRGRGYVQ